jgi:hypothetical protein
MRERRNQFEKIADTISGWSNRRQRAREPRVLVYGSDGHPQLIRREAGGHAEIIDAAERLVALATDREQPDEQEETTE